MKDNTLVIAPPLPYAEVPSVLRTAVFHKRLTEEKGCGLRRLLRPGDTDRLSA
ncbi:MAG: hypothetical protein NZ951_03795 [Dehalococcoidia bacterium]|nr:hypothetical protein [Dehalococcoidia bacterium]MDW8120278.1 hypothetical protein [Chloroflexota bacterium]